MDCAVCVLAGTVAKIKPGLQLLHCQFRDVAPFGKFILPKSMEKRAARKACVDLPQPRMS
jgi:hypothetical protein